MLKAETAASICLLLASAGAWAADDAASKFHFGLESLEPKFQELFGHGALDRSIGESGTTSENPAKGMASGWKAFGRYQFAEPLGIELSYTDSRGTARGDDILDPFMLADRDQRAIKAYGLTLDYLFPFSETIGALAKIGGNRWKLETDPDTAFGRSPQIIGAGSTGTSWLFGFGAKWDVRRNLGVSAGYEFSSGIDAGRTDRYSISAYARF